MICVPSALPMSLHSEREDRPTLPSIRDLFHEELSRPPRIPSPSLTLAHLRVSDDEETPLRHNFTGGTYGYTSGPSYESRSSLFYHNPPMTRSYTDLRTSAPRSTAFDGPSSHNTYHRHAISADAYHYESGANQNIPMFNFRYPALSRQPLTTISTSVDRVYDDDQTPVAGHRESSPSFPHLRGNQTRPSSGGRPSQALKYECHYCGKGFNRPSSLKIHINSHTGEKPFVCNVEGCGRSFSVLSNMRRHQRVHTQAPPRQSRESSDEAPSPPSSASSVAPPLSESSRLSNSPRWSHRRDSSTSTSSTSSRRSRSVSSDDDEDEQRHREKRTRHSQ